MLERVAAEHSTSILSKACIIMTFYLDISFNEEIASMLSDDAKQLQFLLKNHLGPQRQPTIQITAVQQPFMCMASLWQSPQLSSWIILFRVS